MAFAVVLPKMGMTMVEGTITEWFVADESPVQEGDRLFSFETEKVDYEVNAEASGTLRTTQPVDAVVEAGTPEEKASKQADLVESLFEEAVSDLDELTELTTKSANAIFHVVEQRFSEGLDEFRAAVQTQKPAAAKASAAKPASPKAPQKS